MEILKEMVSVLFENKTISEVKKQFVSKYKRVPIDTPNMSFRLYLSDFGNINLELMMRDKYGFYFKPIGYYEYDGSDIKSIKILKEFETAYISIENTIGASLKNKVSFLGVEENTYIAICSREVSNIAQEIFNEQRTPPTNIISNGIKTTIYQSGIGYGMLGILEARVTDDEYETEEDIFVMYTRNEVKCIDNLYYKLLEKGLLTAIKSE